MLLGLTYQLVRFIADLIIVRTHSDTQLRAEVLALRHQLRVLERKLGEPAWQPGDRILLAPSAGYGRDPVWPPCCPGRRPSSGGIAS